MATSVSATPTESVTSLATITSTPSLSSPVSSNTSTSSSRPPQVYTVKAGAGGFVFEPQELTDVHVGDTVTFEFYPPDHSVARAEFGSACVPYEYTGKGKTGFWSDTQLVKDVDHVGTHCRVPERVRGQN
jgi:plastocyanin